MLKLYILVQFLILCHANTVYGLVRFTQKRNKQKETLDQGLKKVEIT